MKTNPVLPISADVDLACVGPERANPRENVKPNTGRSGCRCDRWGHPCPGGRNHDAGNDREVTALAVDK